MSSSTFLVFAGTRYNWIRPMPPIDWSILQSMLLKLVLPSMGIATALLAILLPLMRAERWRSIAVSIAFLAGLVGGVAVQNSKGELIPFVAIEKTTADAEGSTTEENAKEKEAVSWKFETGWRSLFSVTILAVVSEMLVEAMVAPRGGVLLALFVRCLVVGATATWLIPWGEFSSHPWVYILLSLIIMANGMGLRRVEALPVKPFIPLVLAIVWGGSSTAVMVLAHSARFADLAILFSCALMGVGIVMLLKRQGSTSLCSGPATFIPGLMLSANLNTYSDIPNSAFWLVALAPLACLALYLPPCEKWIRAHPVSLLILFTIPCAVSVMLAVRAEF